MDVKIHLWIFCAPSSEIWQIGDYIPYTNIEMKGAIMLTISHFYVIIIVMYLRNKEHKLRERPGRFAVRTLFSFPIFVPL